MRQTLVGVFDRHADAKRAASLLEERGIPRDSVFLTEADELQDSPTQQHSDTARQEGGVLASVKNFFSDLFSDDSSDDVRAYSEAVRRGGTLVKVEVEDDSTTDAVRETLQTAGAVDIDERMSAWQQGAAQTPAPRAAPSTKKQAAAQRAEQEEVIPVVREDVQSGKRTVRAGGVRVYSRTVSEPVHEKVQLREERAVVERRPVDRAISPGDAGALKDRTVEITESVERPVVQKTARVVEEVVVGKETRQVQADIEDTVRRTEVEVESLQGEGLSDTDTTAFRSDFDSKYAASGGRFEDYEPAYRYGRTMRKDPTHASRSWDDVEPTVQRDWTTKNPGTPWERVKGAVRHGWDRATS